ncbi:MAG TPA: alpha/beta fold hydrolase [Pseudonocardiaceae bacterium]
MDTLLLHGLGATGAVWDGLTDRLDDAWLAPDLPGHGGSARLHRYSFGGMAAAIADNLPMSGPLVVVGHSLGGVVALTLASGWFGVEVAGVVALGVKVEWSEDDLARVAAMAEQPARVFATRDEAERAYVKLSGLPRADPAGVAETEDGWTLAMDLRAFAAGAPDMPALLAAARCPVVLATGEHDPMSRPEHLRALRDDAVTLTGLGHNAHVEDPSALLPLLARVYSAR